MKARPVNIYTTFFLAFLAHSHFLFHVSCFPRPFPASLLLVIYHSLRDDKKIEAKEFYLRRAVAKNLQSESCTHTYCRWKRGKVALALGSAQEISALCCGKFIYNNLALSGC